MIFILSLIIGFGSLILCPIIFILNDYSIGFTILYTILIFLVIIFLFCLLIVSLLPIVGNHFAKTYNPHDKKRWRFMVDISRFSCFWLGIRIKIEGLDTINPNKTLVFYSNHQSYIDPLIYYTVLHQFPHATMYKESISKLQLASGMAKALGGVSIDRSDDRSAMKSMITIIKEVKSGVNFFIFPEGTRSRGIGMHHFKAGSCKIMHKTDALLVMCAIDGSYRKRLSIPFVFTPVYIKIVEVMPSEICMHYTTQELASYLEKKVKKTINDIRHNHKTMKVNKRMLKKFQIQQQNEDVF